MSSQANTPPANNDVAVANHSWYPRAPANNNSSCAFVMVHGILSSSNKCWRTSNAFWPDLICDDPAMGRPPVFLSGFATGLPIGSYSVADCAKEVLKNLSWATPSVLEFQRIVFVCHSLGGIVVRYMLERYREQFRSKAIGLVLLGSPSRGSTWANLLSTLSIYFNNRQAWQLRIGGELIDDIHGRFKDVVYAKNVYLPGLFGTEACEAEMIWRDRIPKTIRWLFPNRLKVVSKESAGQYFGDVTVIPNTDHFSIVTPLADSDRRHLFLRGFYSDFQTQAQTFESSRVSTTPNLDVAKELQSVLALCNTGFEVQVRLRDQLSKSLINKAPADGELELEALFKKHYSGMTPEEMRLFETIRGFTHELMAPNNQRAYELIDGNHGFQQALPRLRDLRTHLGAWLAKYRAVFVPSKDMCLCYTGVEEGVPFPRGIEIELDDFILR